MVSLRGGATAAIFAVVYGMAVTPAAALSARVDALPGESAAATAPPPAAEPRPRPPAEPRPTAKPKPTAAPRAVLRPAPQARRPIPPWIFGRGPEPRLVPPRSIPTGRTTRPADAAARPPAARAGTVGAGSDPATTASTRLSTPAGTGPKPKLPPRAPGAIDVPVAPLD
ncbi:hypothetical protein [Rhodoplanes azumiensis]|uniref:Uncharacterized protein n=1 Tax=Rhodoplanes azumiensis TaxID=1897628 RepID=A0ABW5AKD3_9BRAD